MQTKKNTVSLERLRDMQMLIHDQTLLSMPYYLLQYEMLSMRYSFLFQLVQINAPLCSKTALLSKLQTFIFSVAYHKTV